MALSSGWEVEAARLADPQHEVQAGDDGGSYVSQSDTTHISHIYVHIFSCLDRFFQGACKVRSYQTLGIKETICYIDIGHIDILLH